MCTNGCRKKKKDKRNRKKQKRKEKICATFALALLSQSKPLAKTIKAKRKGEFFLLFLDSK